MYQLSCYAKQKKAVSWKIVNKKREKSNQRNETYFTFVFFINILLHSWNDTAFLLM